MNKIYISLLLTFTYITGADACSVNTSTSEDISSGNVYIDSEKYTEAIREFECGMTKMRSQEYNYYLYYFLAYAYFKEEKAGYLENTKKYAQMALLYATTDQQKETSQSLIKLVDDKINAPSNDKLSWMQYYFQSLNITNAWKKITQSKEVIVAVIDDGIYLNHPDITNIWVNPNAKYGDSKIIDFVGDGMPSNNPVGEHGTMVAGIIGATTGNNEGIAGIAKNVKFMPLRVFNGKGDANQGDIIKAINYAIDNGANIINMSLGNPMAYSDGYDEVIKRAYDKGVLVVIAAGNGDVLSRGQTGLDLNKTPISPICNNGGNSQFSIGVYAGDKDGYRTNWTNYGSCASFMAPGVGIISTSIPVFNSNYGTNYNSLDGTSFSTPIISGILALGYNQYGQVSPSIVITSFKESLVKNSVGNYIVDASKYLDILGQKIAPKKKIETIAVIKTEKEIKLEGSVDRWFAKIQTKYGNLDRSTQDIKYTSLLNQLAKYEGKFTGDKKIILDYLISLIKKELGLG